MGKSQSIFQKTVYGLTGITRGLVFNADGTVIATSGPDKTINLWQLDGTPLRTINAHDAAVGTLAVSPNDNVLASVSEDKTLKLWQLDGTLLRVFKEASATLLSVSWNPNGQRLDLVQTKQGNFGQMRPLFIVKLSINVDKRAHLSPQQLTVIPENYRRLPCFVSAIT